MEARERLMGLVSGLPIAHRVGIVAATVAVALLGAGFMRWVTTPSYSVLYAGMAERDVAAAIDQLDGLGVPYEIENGGTTILVPRDQLYTTRARLAESGVAGRSAPQGYELLEEQGLTISNFRQQVDYQRALEGELTRTLLAMDGVREAQVHLVLPEDSVFTEQRTTTTASVLVTPARPLSGDEVEAITFLVASAVEGLEPDNITVADASGEVLHAPGDAGGPGVAASRQQRQTRAFEQALAADLTQLLRQATGSTASVVVRASLGFDQSETQTESYDPERQVAIREQTSTEQYTGVGSPPGGTVGVDGGPAPVGDEESTYQRDESTREFGVDKVTTRTIMAPGKVERLSVAVVTDDGSLTGATVPSDAEIETLLSAAVGLDPERGDSVAVTRVPMPAAVTAEEPTASMLDELPQYVGAVVLLLVAIGLFLMTRQRGRQTVESGTVHRELATARAAPAVSPPVTVGAAQRDGLARDSVLPLQNGLKDEVAELVRAQPEEIATLLRGWLADRRGVS